MIVNSNFDSWLGVATELAGPAISAWRSVGREGGSRFESSHGGEADRLEAFCRPLLLASICAAAGSKTIEDAAGYDLETALDHGASRRPEASVSLLDPYEHPSAVPEAASLALALWIGDHRLWKVLNSAQQRAVVRWMRKAVTRAASTKNNWRLFGFSTAEFLDSVGEADAKIRRLGRSGLNATEDWYVGRGWYSDGGRSTFDYYNSFAFHFYPQMIGYLRGDGVRDHDRHRLACYLDDLEHLTDAEGAPVRFGRSLTYRFGVMAPMSVAALVPGLGAPRWREGATRSLGYFMRGGVSDAAGLVQLGWRGTDNGMVQRYSGPFASYWFAKSFVSLLADRDSAYWSDRSEPGDSRANDIVLAAPGLVVARGPRGNTLMVNHGSYDRTAEMKRVRDDPMYTRLEYGSTSWPGEHWSSPGNVFLESGGLGYVRARVLRRWRLGSVLNSIWLMRSVGPADQSRGTSGRFGRLWWRLGLGSAWERCTAPRLQISSACVDGWMIHRFDVLGSAPHGADLIYRPSLEYCSESCRGELEQACDIMIMKSGLGGALVRNAAYEVRHAASDGAIVVAVRIGADASMQIADLEDAVKVVGTRGQGIAKLSRRRARCR